MSTAQKNTTQIRLIASFPVINPVTKIKAIATFEGNKIVSFERELGTVRNLQTLEIFPTSFAEYAKQFDQEKAFGLGGKTDVNS